MFTGIIQGTGTILRQTDSGVDRHVVIGFDPRDIEPPPPGASVAVNGACLTATASGADFFEADVSAETLSATTFAGLRAGARVNLEPSLRLGQPLDGHWVSGHVDGVGRVVALRPLGRSLQLDLELPTELARYVARKGSITVDGVSLTVNDVAGARFSVNIVPHTREMTTIAGYGVGTPVNIEVDLVARYLERLLGEQGGTVDLDMLKRHGFASND
jgi:riboflavin synthase